MFSIISRAKDKVESILAISKQMDKLREPFLNSCHRLVQRGKLKTEFLAGYALADPSV